MVTGPETRHRRGGLFEVELRIAMPEHNDVVVDKFHGDAPQREHALVAIRYAFDAAVRQIEDLAREMRDQVKEHVETDRGRVTKFLAGEDYGFIESADGREIYFHRNAVIDGAFDRLKVGSEVAFVEEAGEKRCSGEHCSSYPQASPRLVVSRRLRRAAPFRSDASAGSIARPLHCDAVSG